MADDAKAFPAALTRPSQFALFQAVVWVVFSALVLLPALGSQKVPWEPMVAWVARWGLLGLACSTAVAGLYLRLPARHLQGLRAIPVTLLTCVLAGFIWSLGEWSLIPIFGREPFAPPQVTSTQQLLFGSVRGFFLLSIWSGLFLVNLLSQRVQRALEDSARSQSLADQAQLQLLRSQINPHFLFNALNSVVGLITENPRGAQAMVRDVAGLLRKSLDADTRKETSVEQELELVRLYLRCEQVRFEDRLKVHFEIPDEVKPLQLPPMMLQPLVENAIKHGFHGAAQAPLEVSIRAQRKGEVLVLEVENTGTLQVATAPVFEARSGIGLRNLRGRLSHLFPGAHVFELSEREGRVLAHLELPLHASQEVR